MKGVIFNLVEEVVVATWSADAWDDLLLDTGLDGVYTAMGTYPDDELVALVVAASARFGTTVDDALRAVGRGAFGGLARRYPEFLEGHRSVRDFLPRVDDIIHPEVLKIMPGATLPTFELAERPDGSIEMVYESPRTLCVLAEGLTLGAGDHFGEDLSVHQPECRLRGDDRCVLVVTGAGGRP